MTSASPSSSPAGPPFDRWVGARASTLTRFAFVLTGAMDSADEAVQVALASACLRWRRLAGDESLDERVRTGVVRAHLRRHRRGRGSADAPLVDEDPWLPTAPGALQPGEDAQRVWARCAELAPHDRAALVLRAYEGLPLAEVAAAMGCRPRAAAAHVDVALSHVCPDDSGQRGRRLATVGSALAQYAESAPQTYAPAERAMRGARRLRLRRRALTAASTAAALVVPAAWVLSLSGSAPTTTDPDAGRVPVAPSVDTRDWRWESWGGVQFQVPRSWGHGDLTQWCMRRGPDGPAVDRPEIVSTHGLCSLRDDGRPTYTGGLLLRRESAGVRLSRADVAPYATTRIYTVAGVTLTVIDIDPVVGSAVIDSVEEVGRRDFNGCRPRRERERPSAVRAPAAPGPLEGVGRVGSVSVCRYGLSGWPRPTLISSRRLVGIPARQAVNALTAAPAQDGPASVSGCGRTAREFAVLELWPAATSSAGPTSVVVRYDGCRGHGVDDGRGLRALTAGVLDPILVPPWSGRLAADVRRARDEP